MMALLTLPRLPPSMHGIHGHWSRFLKCMHVSAMPSVRARQQRPVQTVPGQPLKPDPLNSLRRLISHVVLLVAVALAL